MQQPEHQATPTTTTAFAESSSFENAAVVPAGQPVARLFESPTVSAKKKLPSTFLMPGNWKVEVGAMVIVCLLAVSCSLVAKSKVDKLAADNEQALAVQAQQLRWLTFRDAQLTEELNRANKRLNAYDLYQKNKGINIDEELSDSIGPPPPPPPPRPTGGPFPEAAGIAYRNDSALELQRRVDRTGNNRHFNVDVPNYREFSSRF